MVVSKEDQRIIYLLAKAGGPLRKKSLSTATARWGATRRNATLASLGRMGLIEAQDTPARQGQRAGTFYWLTTAGLQAAETLQGLGSIKLPENWRQQHGAGEAPRELPGPGSVEPWGA